MRIPRRATHNAKLNPPRTRAELSNSHPIRLATRPSRLALAQAVLVAGRLRTVLPAGVEITIVPMRSLGDVEDRVPLRTFGDKGAFVARIEQAVMADEADLAVHSLKDVPTEIPTGLWIPTYLPRADPRDVLCSPGGTSLTNLPQGSRIGTGSSRRISQLKAQRPDLVFADIRGNVDTRLDKLRSGEYDAIVLAAAGLIRLGLYDEALAVPLDPDVCTPAPGQGVIAVQCRENYEYGEELLAASDPDTSTAARMERHLARRVGATCTTAFGALASTDGQVLTLRASLATGEQGRNASVSGPVNQESRLVEEAAVALTGPVGL